MNVPSRNNSATLHQESFRSRQRSILEITIQDYHLRNRSNRSDYHEDFVLLAKANLTIPEHQLDFLVEKTITSTKADFYLAQLTRIMALAPGRYDDKVIRAATELPGLWMSKGDNQGVFWSENHFLLWHSCSMILEQHGGIPLPEGWRERIVFFLKDKIDIGYYEFASQRYYPYSLAGLLNLYDFAQDAEIKELARKATLRLLQDFVKGTTADGFFRVATGRATRFDDYTFNRQNPQQHQTIALLGLGLAELPNSTIAFTSPSFPFLATSDIDVGELLMERVDHIDEVVQIGRSIRDFREKAKSALTDKHDRITASWSMGQYFHPDTAYELFENIDHYDLWGNPEFEEYAQFQFLGPKIARLVATIIKNLTCGSILFVELALWRHGGAMLSSIQNGYFRGIRPAQQQPFFAVAGPAAVFTHASGDLNPKFEERDNLQTHLPHIKQMSNVALLIYQPNRDINVFAGSSTPVSLHWPSAYFSEEATIGNWKIARHDESFVAMWTPCSGVTDGFIVCKERQQVWASVVGTAETHGSFGNFTEVVSSASPTINGGRCYGASLEVDNQTVSIERWCQKVGQSDRFLAVLITYGVTMVLGAILFYLYCRTKVEQNGKDSFLFVIPRASPITSCKFMIGVIFWLIALTVLIFAFAVGFYGDGSPAAIVFGIIGISVYVALHSLFACSQRFKYWRRRDF